VVSIAVPFKPPAASTRPSASKFAVWACRGRSRLPARIHVPRLGV
jgi:hypothetical protein